MFNWQGLKEVFWLVFCYCPASVMLFNMFLSACFLLVSAGWFVFVLLEFYMW